MQSLETSNSYFPSNLSMSVIDELDKDRSETVGRVVRFMGTTSVIRAGSNFAEMLLGSKAAAIRKGYVRLSYEIVMSLDPLMSAS